MAVEPHTTRRTLFAMALPLGASVGLVASASASQSDGSIADVWAHARAREERADSRFFGSEDALDAETVEIDRMIAAVLRGPIRTRADAIAKLRAGCISLDRGMREDGLDEPAFEHAIRWLEAH